MRNKAYSYVDHRSVREKPLSYVAAVIVVFVTIGVAFLVHRLIPHASLSLLFLVSVLIFSARTGLGPSLVASVLSFLAYNFFFTPPYYTFEVADDGNVATLVFFLLVATITGNLAARMHEEIASHHASLQRISNLYDFSRRMSSAAGTEAVLDALADHLSHSLNRPVAVLLTDSERKLTVRAKSDPLMVLPEADTAVAWSQTLPEPIMVNTWQFFKLFVNQEPIGMLTMQGTALDAEQTRLVRSLCDQAAVALDRTQLVADLEQTRLVSETEQLRSALLSSISHDLRTPLASIIGSTTSLLEYGESFSDENRKELLATTVEEAQRLDRYIQNLLDMTRLGQGSLNLLRDWVDLHDIISSALDRMNDAIKGMIIDIDVSPDVPLLWVHGVLIEQAIVNLLDNAVRFSPDNGRITISARRIGNRVEIDLCDEGPGIPADEREKIFDMFYTVRQGDRSHLHGTGLGLAICRGMVAAHGGNVTARDGRLGTGTCMRIELPIERTE